MDESKLLDQKISARRRLIRGAFVAPAALTVFSGSAFAQASMTCVSKRVADPVLPQVSGTPDAFLRVPLYGLGNGGNVSTWIKGADVLLLAVVDPSKDFLVDVFLTGDDWLCVSKGQGNPNGSWVIGKTYIDPKLPNGNRPYLRPYLLDPGRLAAVRVNASGDIIGIVDVGDNTGSAVGWASCWASFTGVGFS